MIPAASRMASRVVVWHGLFSGATAALVGFLAPELLLLKGVLHTHATAVLFVAILGAGFFSIAYAWRVLRRHRYLLRGLALGSDAIEPFELALLSEEPWRLTIGWVVPAVVLLALAAVLRPAGIDLTMGINLSLLGIVMVAAASLPLYVLVRSEVLSALELAPPEAMHEVLQKAEQALLAEQRVSRRILAAIATPVAFLALGSALIANAHLRRADERQREETARAFARAVLDVGEGVLAEAGVDDALARAAELGFRARILRRHAGYRIQRDETGRVELVIPFNHANARIRFNSTTGSVLSVELVAVSLAAIVIAALIGLLLGHALSSDLRTATRGVHLLGTDVVLSGGSVVGRARFRAVGKLLHAIESLALRFRVFAQAQVRAIEAREAATRMRGQFFASVSHDLKSPLNAILGFSDLVRQHERLTPGQLESLELIERRGRELLALVETILDAARVEAGQLKLVLDRVDISELFSTAIVKGRDLGGEHKVDVIAEFAEGLPAVQVDRVRMARALATFIGHAMRTAERTSLRVRATATANQRVLIEVEIPSRMFSARQLEAMLNPNSQPGTSPHRGLALALGLARSMVELHAGTVHVQDRSSEGAAFTIDLPVQPSVSASGRARSSRPPTLVRRS